MQKCLICGNKYKDMTSLCNHMDSEHCDVIPEKFSAARYNFYLKHGRSGGICRICKKETKFNETTLRPYIFCDNPKCKELYRQKFLNNMTKKYGKECLLDDPEVQKKMLANRKISGTYTWSDGSKKQYVGSYELDFLKFLDIFMNFESDDIFAPAPQILDYTYEEKKHFYIPDLYIQSINTIIEIKDGGDNPNTHHKIQDVDKVKEKLKDETIVKSNKYNYIKIVNKQYASFIEFLLKLKETDDDKNKFKPVVLINENVSILNEQIIIDDMFKPNENNEIFLIINNKLPSQKFVSFDMSLSTLYYFTDKFKKDSKENFEISNILTDISVLKLYLDNSGMIKLCLDTNIDNNEDIYVDDDMKKLFYILNNYYSITDKENKQVCIFMGSLKDYKFEKIIKDKFKKEYNKNKELLDEKLEFLLSENNNINHNSYLDDEDFGLSDERLFPINNIENLKESIKFFKFCPEIKKNKLANIIYERINEKCLKIDYSSLDDYINKPISENTINLLETYDNSEIYNKYKEKQKSIELKLLYENSNIKEIYNLINNSDNLDEFNFCALKTKAEVKDENLNKELLDYINIKYYLVSNNDYYNFNPYLVPEEIEQIISPIEIKNLNENNKDWFNWYIKFSDGYRCNNDIEYIKVWNLKINEFINNIKEDRENINAVEITYFGIGKENLSRLPFIKTK